MVTWTSPLDDIEPEAAALDHPVWQDIADRFKPAEFERPEDMDAGFLRWLHRVRNDAGVPFRINSDARPVDGDVGADRSAHKKRPCRAVDVQAYNAEERARILIAAVANGCRRVGIYPGKDRREEQGWPPHATDAAAVHIDCSNHPDNPSPRIWTRF